MKRKTIKPIIISALMAVSFGATAVGTTFALFTDRADTKIDVTAGVVDINTELKLVKYENIGSEVSGELENKTKNFTNEKEYETEIGTTFEVEGQNLTVTNMVPGDKLTVSVALYNKSNVKTKYRLTASNDNGALASAIKTTVTDGKTNWTPLNAYLGTDAKGELVETAIITLEFVEHGEGEILAKEDEDARDNQHMGQKVTYTLSYEAVQGNAHVADSEPVFDTYVETVKRPSTVEEGNPYEFKTTVGAGLLTVSGMSETDDDVVVSASNDDPTNYTFEVEDETATEIRSYDFKVTNFDENVGVNVEVYVGTGLGSVKVYHTVNGINELVSPVNYSAETGYVSFWADSFSPYHFVLRAPKATIVYNQVELAEALEDATITDIYIGEVFEIENEVVINPGKTVNIHIYDGNGHATALYNCYENGRLFKVSEGSNLTIDGGMLIIPSYAKSMDFDNTASYGFFNVKANSKLAVKDTLLYGDTDNGAFIRVDQSANAHIELNGVTAQTNYRIIASGSYYCWSELIVKDCEIVHKNKDVRSGGMAVPAFWLMGYDSTFENTIIRSDIGSCVEIGGYMPYTKATFRDNHFVVGQTHEGDSWNNVPISVSNNGQAFVESGIYDGGEGYGAYIFTSGGELIVNGGTFIGKKASIKSDYDSGTYGKYNRYSSAKLNAGNFYGPMSTNGDARAELVESEGIAKYDYEDYVRTGPTAGFEEPGIWPSVPSSF